MSILRKVLKIALISVAVLFGLVILLVIYSAVARLVYYHTVERNSPFNQKNTHWVSDCGRVSFTVDDDGDNCVDGTITLSDGTIINIQMCEWIPERRIIVYDYADSCIDEVTDGFGKKYEFLSFKKEVACLKHRYYKKDYFVAIVKESTYFEKGERFVFRKVADI